MTGNNQLDILGLTLLGILVLSGPLIYDAVVAKNESRWFRLIELITALFFALVVIFFSLKLST
jgi:hypothetical protein